MENGIYRRDNPSSRIEKSKRHMIQVTHSLLENNVIFYSPLIIDPHDAELEAKSQLNNGRIGII